MQRDKVDTNLSIVTEKWNRIITLQDLMDLHNLNPELWDCIKQEQNVWEQAQNKKDWTTEVIQLHQVKWIFQPKTAPQQVSLAEILKWYNPPKRDVVAHDWASEKLWTIFIPDAHLWKLDIKWTTLWQKVLKIKKAFASLLDREYNNGADEILIASLWDTLNSDMNGNKTTKWTPMENNSSEKDMRKAAIDLFSELWDRAWERFKTTMRFIPWNHDSWVTTPLNTTMEFVFKNNPNVSVKWDADTRQYHRYGNSLIWLAHWDTVKPKDLPNLMVNEANQSWVKHRERYLWHRHKMIAEDIGWTLVTSLPAVCEKNKRWKDFWVDLTNNILSWTIHDKKYGREAILFQDIK